MICKKGNASSASGPKSQAPMLIEVDRADLMLHLPALQRAIKAGGGDE